MYNKNISHATCSCEIFENAVFFMQGLNKSLPNEHLPSYSHDIFKKFSCDSNSQDCMNSECNIFKLPKKTVESGVLETDDTKFDEWRQVDRRLQLIIVKTIPTKIKVKCKVSTLDRNHFQYSILAVTSKLTTSF